MFSTKRTALTIAGSDPTGGAGAQSDILTFQRHNLSPLSVITAITAQDGERVTSIFSLDAKLVRKQLDTLMNKYRPSSVKIGMLATAGIVKEVRLGIKRHNLTSVVLDPVMTSSSGRALIDKDGIIELRELINVSKVITPNKAEAESLTGLRIGSLSDVKEAALALHKMGAKNVVITGGHLKGKGKGASATLTDTLYDGRKFYFFEGERITVKNKDASVLHGTGCVFSSALASNLALGNSLRVSVQRASKYVGVELKRRIKENG